MRKRILFLLIVAGLTAACSVREETECVDMQLPTIRFVAEAPGDPATRTAFAERENGDYPTWWTERDTAVAISLNLQTPRMAPVVPDPDHRTARFDYVLDAPASSYTFHLLTPGAAVEARGTSRSASGISPSRKAWIIRIPSVQTPGPNSPDESAQILAATTDTEEQLPARMIVPFRHVTAYGRLNLLNLPEDAAVSSVTLSCATPLSGSWYLSTETGALEAFEASSSLILRTSSKEDVWFACAPGDVSGAIMKVIVSTDKGTYQKTFTLPKDHSFKRGHVASFSVDFASVKPSTDHPYEDDPVLTHTEYGAYYLGSEQVYHAGTDQLFREYAANGKTLTFSLIMPSTATVLELGNIPASLLVGDSFTLQCQDIRGVQSRGSTYVVKVLRVDGAKVWLSDGLGNGFIIKK